MKDSHPLQASRLSKLATAKRESLYRDVGGDQKLMHEVVSAACAAPVPDVQSEVPGGGLPNNRIPALASFLPMTTASRSSNLLGQGGAANNGELSSASSAASPTLGGNTATSGRSRPAPGAGAAASWESSGTPRLHPRAAAAISTGQRSDAVGVSVERSETGSCRQSKSQIFRDSDAANAASASRTSLASGLAMGVTPPAAAAAVANASPPTGNSEIGPDVGVSPQHVEQHSLLAPSASHAGSNQATAPPAAPPDPDSIPNDAAELHTLPDGAVGRRAPANPLNSPLVAKLVGGKRKRHPKVKDPKLVNNPLRGRLLVCISTTALLFWIFMWELLYNYTSYNGRCVSPVYYPSYTLKTEDERAPFVVRYGYGGCDHNLGALAKPRAALGKRAGDKGWPLDLVPNGSAGSSNAEWDSPNPRIFRALGGLETNYIRNYGELFRLFTSMYLHGGWLHILINISCQIQMFWIIEPDWGFLRTTLLFFIGGITGSLLSAVADPCNITVGSSGAMYALLAALIPYCLEYWKSIPRPVCILIFMIVVLIIGIVTGLSGFTDNYAHMGGCVGGILWGFASITTVSACDKCTLGERMATTPPFSWCVPKKTQTKLLQRAQQRKAEAVRRRKVQLANKKKAGGARGKAMYAVKMRLQEEGRPPCKMSFREWVVRGTAAAGLIAFWVVMFLYLLDSKLYKKYPPPGQLKFEGWLFCKCGTIVYQAKQTIGNLGKFWCFSSQKDVDFYLKP